MPGIFSQGIVAAYYTLKKVAVNLIIGSKGAVDDILFRGYRGFMHYKRSLERQI